MVGSIVPAHIAASDNPSSSPGSVIPRTAFHGTLVRSHLGPCALGQELQSG
eukprot:COSAG01_NODE_8121_length_2913_cov_105.004264_3_plen_51_part_00